MMFMFGGADEFKRTQMRTNVPGWNCANLVEEKDKKVKELEENIAAVAFTANSKMGKALMAQCKTLQEENDEIGRQNEEGEVSKRVIRTLYRVLH
ncbi:hypothetical protein LWI29_034651 [Acer saccharum]|uniref:Uncharacterized protein n=1 Tax=Acer saccharum TaxID=4024 RepID=A0AA39SPL0_ACESA|nr:hypothetical protein LWI29_034651 [Acer saccharum]